MIDTSRCSYEQYDARRVKVAGSRFVAAKRYTIKLEGAQCIGYRAISIAGTRDPILIGQIDAYVDQIRGMLDDRAKSIGPSLADYKVKFRLYGKNAVIETDEPRPHEVGYELGIVIDVVGCTKDIANDVLAMACTLMLHTEFEGRLCIAGNRGFLIPHQIAQSGLSTASASGIWWSPTVRARCSHGIGSSERESPWRA